MRTTSRLVAALVALSLGACGPLGSTPCESRESDTRCDGETIVFCGVDEGSGAMILLEAGCQSCQADRGGFSCENGAYDSDGTLVRGSGELDARPH